MLRQVENQEILNILNPIKAPSNIKHQDKYCRFHNDFDHNTNYYFDSKEEIETFIPRGQLKEFITGHKE